MSSLASAHHWIACMIKIIDFLTEKSSS